MRHLVVASVLVVLAAVHPIQAWDEPAQDRASEARQSPTDGATKVNLNTADQKALESLPGVGPRTAELIIEYRGETGGFKKVEELMNVRGIGERTFLRLRELVQIGAVEEGR